MTSSTLLQPGLPGEWGTESRYGAQSVEEVREHLASRGIRKSVIDRGLSRIKSVRAVPGGWMVAGDGSKGDWHPSYRVTLQGRKYHCSCYDHGAGGVRRAKICSHVLAVITARRTGQV